MASEECKTVAPIKTAVRSVTKASDVREDNALFLQPYSNWEQFLMPGPLSVAILGEIIFLSAGQDFAIDKGMPKEGFKFMKYPKSFRTSLVQVSNEGWEAFQIAHKNMDQIRLLSVTVPTDMKDVVKFFMQKNPKYTEDFLPIPLNSIKSTTDKCLKLSTVVEEKFNAVIRLINELLEACTSSKGDYDKQLHEIQFEKERAAMQEEASKERKAMIEKHHQKLEAQMKEAKEDYKASMDSIPVGWDAVGMAMAETLVNGFSAFISGSVLKAFSGESSNKCHNSSSRNDHNNTYPNSAEGVENDIIYKAETLQNVIQHIRPFLNEDNKINLSKLNSADGADMLSYCKKSLDDLQQKATDGMDCKEKHTALMICKAGIGICEELVTMGKSKQVDKNKMADLAVKIKQVMQKSITFTSLSKGKTGSMGLTASPPHIATAQPAEGLSGVQTASLNARIKVDQSAAQLRASQEMYEKSFENIMENNKELQQVLETLKRCNVQEIDFNTTVEMLLKGLDALGRVKEQWGKMVLFFTMMSNLIESSLNPSLLKFTEYSQNISGYSPNQLTQDLLYTQISHATNIASLVHMIAETYVQVSTHHLMDRINCLGKLLGLDPKRDIINNVFQSLTALLMEEVDWKGTQTGTEWEWEHEMFGSDCDEASKAREDLVKMNKEFYEKCVQTRIDRINNSVKILLSTVTTEEMKGKSLLQRFPARCFAKADEGSSYGLWENPGPTTEAGSWQMSGSRSQSLTRRQNLEDEAQAVGPIKANDEQGFIVSATTHPTSSSADMGKVGNEYFASGFTKRRTYELGKGSCGLRQYEIKKGMGLGVLKSIKVDMSSEYDWIYRRLLKETKWENTGAQMKIFASSLLTDQVMEDWRAINIACSKEEIRIIQDPGAPNVINIPPLYF
ncbi:uncharacterized protein LOC116976508 [Amblyraja radiata]|uniref:uncharacterized protein LOC116976508 n=1 Tax=Amblyraja radiata TaxID=386614 RepID=UPI001403F36F|nr:uncharacterized protein LOC116976508 [Amblyraja radiata]